jgi:hypothetical protein
MGHVRPPGQVVIVPARQLADKPAQGGQRAKPGRDPALVTTTELPASAPELGSRRPPQPAAKPPAPAPVPEALLGTQIGGEPSRAPALPFRAPTSGDRPPPPVRQPAIDPALGATAPIPHGPGRGAASSTLPFVPPAAHARVAATLSDDGSRKPARSHDKAPQPSAPASKNQQGAPDPRLWTQTLDEGAQRHAKPALPFSGKVSAPPPTATPDYILRAKEPATTGTFDIGPFHRASAPLPFERSAPPPAPPSSSARAAAPPSMAGSAPPAPPSSSARAAPPSAGVPASNAAAPAPRLLVETLTGAGPSSGPVLPFSGRLAAAPPSHRPILPVESRGPVTGTLEVPPGVSSTLPFDKPRDPAAAARAVAAPAVLESYDGVDDDVLSDSDATIEKPPKLAAGSAAAVNELSLGAAFLEALRRQGG